MSNQAISKVELQKLIDTKNSFVNLSVKYDLGINTDEFAKFPSFFDKRLTENKEEISSLENELESVQGELTETQATLSQTQADLTETTANLQEKTEELNAIYEEVGNTTATASDLVKGKTAYGVGGTFEGTLDVETEKAEAEAKALDDMWDYIQQFGARTNYDYLGRIYWTRKNFKPNYSFNATGAYYMFESVAKKHEELLINDGQIVMKELEVERDIVFDFSRVTNMTRAFAGSPFSELNVIDISSATSLLYAFYGGYWSGESFKLKRIERLICSENTTFDNTTFQYSNMLTYIGFEGIIAKNGLNISWSTKLDKESHVKLVNILSSTTSGLSVTVSLIAINKAFETNEGANDGSTSQEWLNLIATKSNWTISLV